LFVQIPTTAAIYEDEWAQIQATVLAASSQDGQYLDEGLTDHAEASTLEFINSEWIQRVAPKMVPCSVEEHPEALQASIIAPKDVQNTNTKKWF
jgi:hypothetical protein